MSLEIFFITLTGFSKLNWVFFLQNFRFLREYYDKKMYYSALYSYNIVEGKKCFPSGQLIYVENVGCP